MLRTSVLLLLVLLLCGGKTAMAERTIVCATSADAPPVEFIDKEGNIAGYAIDVLRAAGRIAGFKAEFKKVARESLAAGLQDGQYDALCATAYLGEEARKAMDFTSPYLIAQQVMVVNADTRVNSTTSAQGMYIGVLAGARGDLLPGARIKPYQNLGRAMEDLYVNRLFGVVCDNVVAAYFAKVKYQNKLTVTGYLREGARVEYAVAVKKGNKEALQLLDEGISGVVARDITREFGMKWFTQ